MVIIDAPLDHSRSGLSILGRASLIRHSGGLKLNYNLRERKKGKHW